MHTYIELLLQLKMPQKKSRIYSVCKRTCPKWTIFGPYAYACNPPHVHMQLTCFLCLCETPLHHYTFHFFYPPSASSLQLSSFVQMRKQFLNPMGTLGINIKQYFRYCVCYCVISYLTSQTLKSYS